MKKKRFLDRFFKKSEKELLKGGKNVQDTVLKTTKTIEKGVEDVSDVLFGRAVKELKGVSKDFNHLTDKFLNTLLKEEWTTKGIYAKDIMENATKIKENDSVKKVINRLKGEEDSLIVIRGKNKIVGVIDEFNLVKMAIPQENIGTQEVIGFMGAGYDRAYLAKTAKDLMKKDVYFVTPSTPMEKIAFIMHKTNLRAIPVISSTRIVGVVHVRNVVGSLK